MYKASEKGLEMEGAGVGHNDNKENINPATFSVYQHNSPSTFQPSATMKNKSKLLKSRKPLSDITHLFDSCQTAPCPVSLPASTFIATKTSKPVQPTELKQKTIPKASIRHFR
ncbi:hypothetical protein POM88_017035 [Heracleum sosnowskyi]|uniref:Uncharacterized protein n=1 Tax=Heracleum sosnowskyi TaxID=360622 RepID=A0AAD8IR06_9APIA|nr:hypothetical protein POM88_017035 [Heracleum sosnowskyi]